MKTHAIIKNLSNPRKWFAVNAADDEPEVLIYDMIGADFWGEGVRPKDFRNEIEGLAKDHKSMTLRINSPGGFVHDGFAIYNTLKQSGMDITVYVDGLAASAAAFIAMAGNKIYMPPSAEIMIHDAWGFVMGNSAAMLAEGKHLESLTGQIANIFCERTGMKLEDVRALMSAETWMDGDESVEKGFADALLEESKAAACAFDLDMFDGIPKDFMRLQTALKKRAEEKNLREAGSSRAEAARCVSQGSDYSGLVNETIEKEFAKWQLKKQ
jgi:ATP-dependent Clp protease, protease subunit